MPYIFGPVPSRRLGLSLGVDLIPEKTCTYDCLYCQVGKTTIKAIETGPLTPVREVMEELGQRLEKITPDVITLSGSGEPTLHSQIDQVIDLIKGITDIKIALLTNGSLFWKEQVRKKVLGADIIMPVAGPVGLGTAAAVQDNPGTMLIGVDVDADEVVVTVDLRVSGPVDVNVLPCRESGGVVEREGDDVIGT